MADSIVLVPGLGLGGAEMLLLARRLRKRGYSVTLFRHCPWCRTLSDKAAAFQQLVSAIDRPIVHFVGHSMGGLIVLQMLADSPHQRPGRVILLGTPMNGSAAAQRVLRLPLGKFLIGTCMTTACAAAPLPLPHDREVGSIAGRINLGIGWLLWLPRPNDTVVAVVETQRTGTKETAELAVSHTGMLLSTRVAAHVDSFLKTGAFASVVA